MNAKQKKAVLAVTNVSLVMASQIMGDLSPLLERFAASASELAKKSKEELRKSVKDKMTKEVKELITDLAAQVDENMKSIPENKLPSDEECDLVIAIVDTHKVSLPKVYDKLSTEDLAAYGLLLAKEVKEVSDLFAEVLEWAKSYAKT